jgi:adenylosuccinate lyase
MLSLGETLIGLSRGYRSTRQIGRTHGQHAEPITFGRKLAVHLDKWGEGIEEVKRATKGLKGKIGGAVGTKAALSLLGDPYDLEKEILGSVGLEPARISTQILHPEYAARYYAQLVIAFGTLENLANDMRELTKTEIGEIVMKLPEGHGESSSMPGKGLVGNEGEVTGNPEDYENTQGQYRANFADIIAVFLNQRTEQERDLINSSTERYFKPGILSPFVYSVKRMDETMKSVIAKKDVMEARVRNAWNSLMGPASISLTLNGDKGTQKYVRDAAKRYGDFNTALQEDSKLRSAIEELPDDQRHIFDSPMNYIGSSERQVDDVCEYWSPRFAEMRHELEARGVQNG